MVIPILIVWTASADLPAKQPIKEFTKQLSEMLGLASAWRKRAERKQPCPAIFSISKQIPNSKHQEALYHSKS